MLSKALTSLRGLFHPILRFLGMTATPPPTEVEFGCYRVLEWENALLARYRSRDPESSPMHRSRMDALKVTTIRRFKEKKHPEHEYLVAEVYDPDLGIQGRNRYLRIERCVGAGFPHTQDDTTRHSIPTTSSQSSLVLKKFPAVDYVQPIATWPTVDICIGDFTCQDSQMIVLDLAIVAKVVHDHSAEYQILTSQCFWFSAVIVSVLQKAFSQIKVSNSASSLKADHGQDLAMENKKGGTYKNFTIYSERPEVITEIYDRFVTYKDQIYSSVNLLNAGYNFFANYLLP
jgi:hypothetical protein